MSASVEDYCDLCDLPRSQCPHGRPPKPVEPASAPVAKPAPRRTARTTSTRTPGAPAKPVRRRWTPADDLEPHILAVLRETGGELDADDVMRELETRLEDQLLAGDRETTPEGELRWRYAARKARQSLARQGLMATGRPGVWQLTPQGLQQD
ncbi:winged helix-turn-helix domain-containing protein [Nocardioides pacificus]